MRTLGITVEGRVQGVFFRKSTQDKAHELGLTGSVRNQPDGSVYIEVQGNQLAVDALVKWCHKGPELAKVHRVTTEDIPALNTDDFRIVR